MVTPANKQPKYAVLEKAWKATHGANAVDPHAQQSHSDTVSAMTTLREIPKHATDRTKHEPTKMSEQDVNREGIGQIAVTERSVIRYESRGMAKETIDRTASRTLHHIMGIRRTVSILEVIIDMIPGTIEARIVVVGLALMGTTLLQAEVEEVEEVEVGGVGVHDRIIGSTSSKEQVGACGDRAEQMNKTRSSLCSVSP